RRPGARLGLLLARLCPRPQHPALLPDPLDLALPVGGAVGAAERELLAAAPRDADLLLEPGRRRLPLLRRLLPLLLQQGAQPRRRLCPLGQRRRAYPPRIEH